MKYTGTTPAMDRSLCFSFQTFRWRGEREIGEGVKICFKGPLHTADTLKTERSVRPHTLHLK